VKGIIAIEPEGPPFMGMIVARGKARPYGVTTLPITYDPAMADPSIDLVTMAVASPGKGSQRLHFAAGTGKEVD
jgi:hypothetical protein